MTTRAPYHPAVAGRAASPASAKQSGADFVVSGGGTLYLLTPLTDAAKDWVDQYIDPDHQSLGNSIAVEHRYIAGVVEGIVGDGLRVE